MKLARRKLLRLAAGAVALPAVSRVASAQTYPTRPVTMIVPAPAGGPLDVLARTLAGAMRGPLGQTIIIENVAGADGSIGVGRLARAKPDGYTIDIGITTSHVLNGASYSLQYDVLNDFVPILPLIRDSYVLVARSTFPARDLRELIAWLKANPNKASVAVAVGGRLQAMYFQRQTGTQFGIVPYRGTAPAMQDLVAGQIDLLCCDALRTSLPLIRAGSIKGYAMGSDARRAAAPDIPTYAEMGLPALSYSEWCGLFAPKGTQRDIVGKLNAAAVTALADPAVRSPIVEFGAEIFSPDQQTPETLAALVKADAEKWWPLMKELGIKAE
jgi:tripartite-type tricarboxylate transporter receptor subunit TctC